MKNKKQAFTLTELLIALGIIGAIAAISIPSLMTTINNRVLVNQLKSTVGAIQQLAADQMVVKNTKSLLDTDFANVDDLLTDTNFTAVKICKTSSTAQAECWKTTASGKSKVQYRLLNGAVSGFGGTAYKAVVLKNGAILGYQRTNSAYGTNDKIIGDFCVDVNGNEPPNMRGRDYFCMQITNKGKIVDISDTTMTLENKINTCKGNSGSANYCYGAVVDSGWKMPY